MVASSEQSNGVETLAERRKKVAAEIGHSRELQATSKLANKKKQSATITGDGEKKKKQQSLDKTNGKWRQVDAEREPDQQPVQAKVKTRSGLLGALLGGGASGGAGSRHTILSIQNGAPTQVTKEATKDKTSAGAESKTLGEQTSSKYSGLPTFGSIPQKLNSLSNNSTTQQRVPYFSYHGNARNLKHHHSLASSRQLSSSCSQLSSTQSTSSSSSSASSGNQIKIVNNKQQTSRKASLLGFSNLSNLFPGEPRRLWPARNQQATLNSISDIRLASQQKARATMRRTNTSSQQHLAGSGSSLVGGPGKLMGGRLRPASASGHYNTLRSPSYRLGSAGMSPMVDPDCPMHGDGPPPPATGGGRGSRYTPTDEQYEQQQQQQQRDNNTRSRYHSASQPDLLYNNDATASMTHQQSVAINDDPYNARTSGGGGAFRGSPIYGQSQLLSPSANYEQASNWTGQQQETRRANYNAGREYQQPAYYNGQSRFSQYHATGDGRIGSSLAPTGEQLRRILGYKPPGYQASKPVHLHPQWAYTRPFIHLQPAGSGFGRSPSPAWLDDEGGELGVEGTSSQPEVPKFAPFNRLQDNQAIRAVDFHPSGEVYAIGSNSRALRICAYPAEHELRHFDPFDDLDQLRNSQQQQQQLGANKPSEKPARPPRVLFKFLQVHRGSIYCVSFNPSGQLLATGSNDQTIHIVKYNSITHNPDGEEFRLTMHNGTIRDLCFIDDSTGNGSSLLLSAGGGDNKIYVTDCDTITPFQSMAGHTQMVMALNHCGGAQFVSGSYDRTIRFWDLRSRSCTSIVSAPPLAGATTNNTTTSGGGVAGPGAPVCALRVDPSGRLLASGHTDTTCMLYDIRGGKIIQTFRPHDDEIRAISFSPKSYYLLTGGYDGRLVVSDLQGDLTQPLPSVCVAQSQDKIVQAKWHPADFTFVSTSADKSATLWSLPGEIRN